MTVSDSGVNMISCFTICVNREIREMSIFPIFRDFERKILNCEIPFMLDSCIFSDFM